MKIYLMGDPHLRASTPRSRKDVFPETQFQKIQWAFEQYENDPLSFCMVLPGDVFDSHEVPHWIIERYISYWNNPSFTTPPHIMAVFGQHDQRYHTSDKKNTPLGIVNSALPNFRLLGADPVIRPVLGGEGWTALENGETEVHFYGASWGEPIPKVIDKKAINILVVHKMFTKGGPLFPGQTDFTEGKTFLMEHDFKYVLSGDNHTGFFVKYKEKLLINPGSIMRQNSDQMYHNPCLYIIDILNETYTAKPFPILPISDVFDLEKAEAEKEKSKELEEFITSLRSMNKGEDLDFKRNLLDYTTKNIKDDDVKKIIEEIMEE